MIVFHLNYQLLSGTLGVEVLLQPCVSAKVTSSRGRQRNKQHMCVFLFFSLLFIYRSESVCCFTSELSANHTSWLCPGPPFTLHHGGFVLQMLLTITLYVNFDLCKFLLLNLWNITLYLKKWDPKNASGFQKKASYSCQNLQVHPKCQFNLGVVCAVPLYTWRNIVNCCLHEYLELTGRGNRALCWFCSRTSGCYRVCCLPCYRRAPVLLYWLYVGW